MRKKTYCIALLFLLPLIMAADDREPSALFIVHFEPGEAWDASLQPAEQTSFQEHSANMSRLRKEGTIVFGARYSRFGLIILQTESLEVATATLEADPGVQAGIFTFSVEPISVFYPWKTLDG